MYIDRLSIHFEVLGSLGWAAILGEEIAMYLPYIWNIKINRKEVYKKFLLKVFMGITFFTT